MDSPGSVQDPFDLLTPQEPTTMFDNANQDAAETMPTETSLAGKEDKKKRGNISIAVAKATRPLNSWLAFRRYYSIMFTALPQRDISGFLTYLWQADPTKAKWSIVAKAYSEIRDKEGKENAPLDVFLALNAPFVGIIDPDNYLRLHGWEIANQDGQTVLRREHQVYTTEFGKSMLTTNASVEDVIRNTYDQGYIKDGGSRHAGASKYGVALTMATIAQPVGSQSVGGLVNSGAVNGKIATANPHDGLNGIGSNTPSLQGMMMHPMSQAGVLNPQTAQSIHGGVHGPLAGGLATRTDSYLSSDGQLNADAQPNLDSMAFEPLVHDNFDAFHLSNYKYANVVKWVEDGA